MSEWKDAYMLELDFWAANETPMRESLFGAGMRYARMIEYPKAKMPDYGDSSEPCEDCVIKDKRIEELEESIREGIDRAESFGCSDWSISPLVKVLSKEGRNK